MRAKYYGGPRNIFLLLRISVGLAKKMTIQWNDSCSVCVWLTNIIVLGRLRGKHTRSHFLIAGRDSRGEKEVRLEEEYRARWGGGDRNSVFL